MKCSALHFLAALCSELSSTIAGSRQQKSKHIQHVQNAYFKSYEKTLTNKPIENVAGETQTGSSL